MTVTPSTMVLVRHSNLATASQGEKGRFFNDMDNFNAVLSVLTGRFKPPLNQ